MIFVTGDCHADFRKFSTKRFPEQHGMTKDDFVIVCGDFGIWHDCSSERYWLDWLEQKPFTTLFVDGNHENFDRLYGNEFDVVDYHGGKAHAIRDSVLHLMRGNVFTLQNKTFFAFGGASSHDVQDGILDASDYKSESEFMKAVERMHYQNKMFRVNHMSWWKQEIPSDDEMQYGRDVLLHNKNSVDYVITHCLPQEIVSLLSRGVYESDDLTLYFNSLLHNGLKFKEWFCGHYHCDTLVTRRFRVLYRDIMQIA